MASVLGSQHIETPPPVPGEQEVGILAPLRRLPQSFTFPEPQPWGRICPSQGQVAIPLI